MYAYVLLWEYGFYTSYDVNANYQITSTRLLIEFERLS